MRLTINDSSSMQKIFKISLFSFIMWLVIQPVLAVEFDPDYLISDSEMTDYNSMTQEQIQKFLDEQEGTLNKYICVDKEGELKTASQTFYEVAQKWMINPKYLLVLVQKEMSLLSDESPKQTQYDWATGYGCPDGSGCDARWKGFYKQVNSAAAQTRYYMDNIHEFHYQPHQTYTIDSYRVTPKNTATAGLYAYTPHVDCDGKCGGNVLFWDLYNKFFSKKWPDGALLIADDGSNPFLIKDGKKREITSKAVLLSRFDPDNVVTVNGNDLASYDDGPPIEYLNFSLLKDSRGNIYMIDDDKKRKIQSDEVFQKIGFMEDEVISVSDLELAQYEDGPEITKYTLYPSGQLVRNTETGDIFYLISSKKRLVINDEIKNANFMGMTVEPMDAGELDKYRTASEMTLPDGYLVKTADSNTVYVISNGKRLPIFNAKVFTNMKYGWDVIQTVSQQTLDVHKLGQTITGEW